MTAWAVTYRAVRPQDFDALHGLVSLWDVTRNLGSWPWPPEEEFTRKRCMPFEGDGFVWAICQEDALIGTVSVVRGELGYMLHPDHSGRGIVTQAAQTALSHAFNDLGIKEVHADIWADNAPSKHILMKFGFTLAVQEVEHALARNEPTDSETYKLTRTDWFSRNPPRLTTDRLILRPLRRDDADAIVRIAGNYEVSKWLNPVPYPYNLSDAHAFIETVQAGGEAFVWAINQNDALIGLVGVDDILGYYLQPESWGQGLMSEAVAAVIDWRFTDPALDTLSSGFFDGNHGSRRVLEKAGFHPTGHNMGFSTARNEKVPHTTMELTRAAWSSLKHNA